MKARLSLAWLAVWFTLSALAIPSSGDHVLTRTLASPTWLHPFGFDAFGRDLLFTVLRASSASAGFAGLITLASLAIGIAAGGILSLQSERWRFAWLRGLDFFLAFPSLLFALAWAAIRGPGWDTLLGSLALGILPPFTRLMYVRSRELLSEDYLLAARSLGASPWEQARTHLFPALGSMAAIKAPGIFAQALLAEATLSFLGVGAPIGRDTWGALLAQGKDYLLEAPHLAFGVGIPLVLTVLALQSISETLSQRHLRSGSDRW